MPVSLITTHDADGQNRIVSQFIGKTLKSFASINFQRYQELETAGHAMIAARYLRNATGATLEKIGETVGEPRPVNGDASTSDTAYLALILARIIANTTYGTTPDVQNILQMLGAEGLSVRDVYPAAIEVAYTGDPLIDGDAIRTMLEQATAPIEIGLTSYTASPFGFGGNNTNLGFGQGELSSAY